MLDYQTKGCSQYGASMGRGSDLPDGAEGTLQIRKVPLDQGGYDPGGAYWGTPDNLYMVSDADGRVSYSRGASFDAVKARFPRATWDQTMSEDDLADMVSGYAECALWSSTGDDPDFEGDPQDNPGGVPLDEHFSTADLAPETLARMSADCAAFVKANADTLAALAAKGDLDWSRIGHDFWLTRNGHGAGFWDGDYPEPEAEQLTEGSKKFGETWIYAGDDGKLYS